MVQSLQEVAANIVQKQWRLVQKCRMEKERQRKRRQDLALAAAQAKAASPVVHRAAKPRVASSAEMLSHIKNSKHQRADGGDYRQAALLKVYRAFDLDGDGCVSEDELQVLGQVRRRLGHKGGTQRLVNQLKPDAEGNISADSFVKHFDESLSQERAVFDEEVAQYMECAQGASERTNAELAAEAEKVKQALEKEAQVKAAEAAEAKAKAAAEEKANAAAEEKAKAAAEEKANAAVEARAKAAVQAYAKSNEISAKDKAAQARVDAMMARDKAQQMEERRSQSPTRRSELSAAERQVDAMLARAAEEEEEERRSQSPKRDELPKRKPLSTSERMVEEAMAARTRSLSTSVSPKRDGSPTRKAEATTADRRVDEMMARAKARQVARR